MPDRVSASGKMSVRTGVFETNSSSMHSLIVIKDSNEGFPKNARWEEEPRQDGTYTVSVGGNDFGRAPFALLGHPIDKFLYLLASRYSRYSDDDDGRQAFIGQMTSRLDGCCGFDFPVSHWDGKTNYGYVDHQSDGIVWNYIESNGIDVFDFIFDPKSVIIVDGDEYDTWGEMKKSGLIDTGNIAFDLLAEDEEE